MNGQAFQWRIRKRARKRERMESLWAKLKREYRGIWHLASSRHLNRCLREAAGPRAQAVVSFAGMAGKRLRYAEPVA